jgi:hypothetical protein
MDVNRDVDKSNLLNALRALKIGVDAKAASGYQSDCFIFQDNWIYTYNEDVACFKKMGLGVNGAVNADTLIRFLESVSDEHIGVRDKDDGIAIYVKSGVSVIKAEKTIELSVHDIEHPNQADWRPVPECFADAVSMAESCVSHNNSDFLLSSIHVTPQFIESGDMYQLVRFDWDMPIKDSFLVRRERLGSIVEMGVSKVADTSSWIHFKTNVGVRIACRKYMEDYIGDVQDIVTKERKGVDVTIPSGLIKVISAASVFSDKPVEREDDAVEVRFKPDANKVVVVGTGIYGRFKGEAAIQYDGAPIRFMIRPKMLKQLIQQYKSCRLCDTCIVSTGDNFKYFVSVE